MGLIAKEKTPQNKITAIKRLSNIHPLVKLTKIAFAQGHTNHRGQLHYMSGKSLDVRVTPHCLNRALRIYETIIRECGKREITIKIVRNDLTILCINDVEITIRMRERIQRLTIAEQQQQSTSARSYAPTGILVLEIDETSDDGSIRKNFKDSADKKVEDQLNEFFISIYKFSHILRLIKETRDREHERLRILMGERERKELEIKMENERIKQLRADGISWEESQRIREYINAVISHTETKQLSSEEKESLDKWVAWATGIADSIDPIINRSKDK